MDVTILDVVGVLGLPHPKDGQRQYNISCPCCDTKPKEAHLNINLAKGVFNCPRCKTHGGTIGLYMLFTGMDDTKENRKKAYRNIKNGIANPLYVRPTYEPKKNIECNLAPAETRHKTYSALLSHLGLAKSHRDNLLNRGLSDDDIKRLGYKSAPTKNCQKLCKLLLEEGCTLEGVPGFWKNKSGNWCVGDDMTGILIPFKDVEGRILGIQKRLDKPVGKRKFRWVSSTGFPYGTKTENFIHISGNPDARVVILTEGGMKGDIINTLCGKTVVAVPGVNSIQRLKVVLEDLRDNHGLEVVKTAFDMDFLSNEYVEKAYNTLLAMLEEIGITYHILVWDEEYKGLDDYLKHKLIDCKGGVE